MPWVKITVEYSWDRNVGLAFSGLQSCPFQLDCFLPHFLFVAAFHGAWGEVVPVPKLAS